MDALRSEKRIVSWTEKQWLRPIKLLTLSLVTFFTLLLNPNSSLWLSPLIHTLTLYTYTYTNSWLKETIYWINSLRLSKIKLAMEVASEAGQKPKKGGFTLESIKELPSPSSSSGFSSSSPVVAQFRLEKGLAELRLEQESESNSLIQLDLYKTQASSVFVILFGSLWVNLWKGRI